MQRPNKEKTPSTRTRQWWSAFGTAFLFVALLLGVIIDIMGDNIGKQLKAVVKRANDVTATLSVIPEEANPDM
ncbi:hypothetical protein HAX54_002765 [Datura stramonium]|uniref:Uncharacterized protein n=1 Tax=Datura stramonium TaxID=4076 RepID=A0ABS8T4C3_DATST|nr:hypothetical protein [Datura stramonium]